MLIEMLRPGGPELMRRWVAALLLAPRLEREEIVNEVEGRLVELYAAPLIEPESEPQGDEKTAAGDQKTPPEDSPTVHIVTKVTQRDGYVERVERAYSPVKKTKAKKKSSKDARKKRRA